MRKHRVQEVQPDDRHFYAFVEGRIDAEADRPFSRMSLHLDAVETNGSRETSTSDLEESSLFLVRISTTPRRFTELFQVEVSQIEEGDWVELRIGRRQNSPMAWLISAVTNYDVRQRQNLLELRRFSRRKPPALQKVIRACKSKVLRFARKNDMVEFDSVLANARGIRVTVLDVGQASCVEISNSMGTLGYFDVGAPIFANYGSFPKHFKKPQPSGGVVFLSHWDFDHFALAYKIDHLKYLTWFAPAQNVGPNTAAFQKLLGSRLRILHRPAYIQSFFSLAKCTGPSSKDRNSTGYAMTVRVENNSAILFTGDADYQWLPSMIKTNIRSVVIPHHGGKGTSPFRGAGIAAASFGIPNTYHHPDENFLDEHKKKGWRVRRTAGTKKPKMSRSDIKLFP